jgi:hypothetical protein
MADVEGLQTKANARRSLCGPFLLHDLGRGAWRLSRTVPPVLEVIVQGARPDAAGAFGPEECRALTLEWRESGVILTLSAATGDRSVEARGAIIHEPQARLYEGLPLASFDAGAARYWRRIFRIMRVPGGRFLLGFLARRNRSRT